MPRTSSADRYRIGRVSAGSSGSGSGAGGAARWGRAGSVPLRERLGSMQRQGSLAARQGLEQIGSVGAAAREGISRSASVVGASVSRVASNPAIYQSADGDLVRLVSMT